jgi:hypothetical protein
MHTYLGLVLLFFLLCCGQPKQNQKELSTPELNGFEMVSLKGGTFLIVVCSTPYGALNRILVWIFFRT